MSGVTFPLCPPRLALVIAGGDGKTMCVKLKYICKHVVIKVIVCLFVLFQFAKHKGKYGRCSKQSLHFITHQRI